MSKVLVVGSLNMDFVVNVDMAPLPGETKSAKKFTLVPGGKGANQAYALGRLGVNVSMIGAVGKDEYGTKLIANLKDAKVNTKRILKMNNINTGSAFITVLNNGENSILTVGGANKLLDKDIIDKNIDLIRKSDIIVMQLEIPIDVVLYVAKLAKLLGKTVIIDPAPASSNIPDELFKYVNIIKPNETELQILSGMELVKEEDYINAARILINKGVDKVIITLGANGSLLVTKDDYKKFAALKVSVVDTTAAGDSFTAGLIKGLSEGKVLDEAIRYGHIVSSIVVTRHGAQTSIPTKLEVEEKIKKEGF